MKPLKMLAVLALTVAPTALWAMNEIIPTDDELAIFRSAIEQAGCVVDNDDTAATVANATGFDAELLEAVVAQLRIYGEIVDAGETGGIKLISGGCAY